MKAQTKTDKRRELRFLLNAHLTVSVANKPTYLAQCQNISGSGLLIVSAEDIAIGEVVGIELHNTKVEFAANTKAIRSEKSNNDFLIGLEITEFLE